jgi:hypothetical protein
MEINKILPSSLSSWICFCIFTTCFRRVYHVFTTPRVYHVFTTCLPRVFHITFRVFTTCFPNYFPRVSRLFSHGFLHSRHSPPSRSVWACCHSKTEFRVAPRASRIRQAWEPRPVVRRSPEEASTVPISLQWKSQSSLLEEGRLVKIWESSF